MTLVFHRENTISLSPLLPQYLSEMCRTVVFCPECLYLSLLFLFIALCYILGHSLKSIFQLADFLLSYYNFDDLT